MPRKGGEAVDDNGCSMLFESVDLNEVCAATVSTLKERQVPANRARDVSAVYRHTKAGITDSKHYGMARFNFS